MVNLIELLKQNQKVKPLGSCCGHFIYPMTIVVTDGEKVWELMSGVEIPRKRNFYKLDNGGFYYIPEVMKFLEKRKGRL